MTARVAPRNTARVDAPALTPPLPGTEEYGPSERGQWAEWIHLDQVVPNPDNPRTGDVDRWKAGDALTELAASIRAQGLIEPLIVAPRPATAKRVTTGPTDRAEFLLVAGHRRRAALLQLMGTTGDDGEPLHDGRVLVIVRPDLADPAASTAAALVENLHRVDLTPLQEARAFLALRDVHGWSQGAIARAVGRNPGHITKRLTLLNAVPLLTDQIEGGIVPLEVAVDLARLPIEFQQRAATDIARRHVTPVQARAQALADHDAASARTLALDALDAAGLAYDELPPGARPPAASPHGPLPVDFPGFRHVAAAHDVPVGTAVPPCELRYVTRHRMTAVVTDPGANAYPGYDPAFVTGRVCTDPTAHAPAATPVSGSGPASEAPAPAPVSARTRLFSEGSGYVPGGTGHDASSELDGSRATALSILRGAAGAPSTDGALAGLPATADRDVMAATMGRTAFTQRLLADRVAGQATAAITASLLAGVALAPELVLDPGADQGALRLAVTWLGTAGAPTDASVTAARKAALAATFGPAAGVERRARFALAYLLARTEPAVVEAVARAGVAATTGGGVAGEVPPVSHVLAAQHLSTLAAWGHVLHPLEHAVIDTAPTPTSALASLRIGVDPLALEVPDPTPADVAPVVTPIPVTLPDPKLVALADSHRRAGRVRFPTAGEAARMSKADLSRVLSRAGVPAPAGATRTALADLLETARTAQLSDAGR